MAANPARKRTYTYDDVLAAPANMVAELIDGDLYLSPRPRPRHSRLESQINLDVANFDGPTGGGPGEPPGGWWICTEPELHLFGPRAQAMVPDLAGWRRQHLPELPDEAWFSVAPDWVCEIASPKTAFHDRAVKLPKYAEAGVPWAWIVDPAERYLEVLRRNAAGLWEVVAVHGGDQEDVRAEPFTARAIDLRRWWV